MRYFVNNDHFIEQISKIRAAIRARSSNVLTWWDALYKECAYTGQEQAFIRMGDIERTQPSALEVIYPTSRFWAYHTKWWAATSSVALLGVVNYLIQNPLKGGGNYVELIAGLILGCIFVLGVGSAVVAGIQVQIAAFIAEKKFRKNLERQSLELIGEIKAELIAKYPEVRALLLQYPKSAAEVSRIAEEIRYINVLPRYYAMADQERFIAYVQEASFSELYYLMKSLTIWVEQARNAITRKQMLDSVSTLNEPESRLLEKVPAFSTTSD